jgi:hypothetical protein
MPNEVPKPEQPGGSLHDYFQPLHPNKPVAFGLPSTRL